jgi:alpha-L-arabinofuranosidase
VLSPEVKSGSWQTVTADYITLPDTREIEIRVRRLEGAGSKGKIFVRNLRFQKFTPFNLGAVPIISAVASRSKDGKRICVAIVNKNLGTPTDVRILGINARKVSAWTLTGQSVDATNEVDPNAIRPVRLSDVIVKRNEIALALSPHSLTVVVAE